MRLLKEFVACKVDGRLVEKFDDGERFGSKSGERGRSVCAA